MTAVNLVGLVLRHGPPNKAARDLLQAVISPRLAGAEDFNWRVSALTMAREAQNRCPRVRERLSKSASSQVPSGPDLPR